jgi:hypothetical protein
MVPASRLFPLRRRACPGSLSRVSEVAPARDSRECRGETWPRCRPVRLHLQTGKFGYQFGCRPPSPQTVMPCTVQ